MGVQELQRLHDVRYLGTLLLSTRLPAFRNATRATGEPVSEVVPCV